MADHAGAVQAEEGIDLSLDADGGRYALFRWLGFHLVQHLAGQHIVGFAVQREGEIVFDVVVAGKDDGVVGQGWLLMRSPSRSPRTMLVPFLFLLQR